MGSKFPIRTGGGGHTAGRWASMYCKVTVGCGCWWWLLVERCG